MVNQNSRLFSPSMQAKAFDDGDSADPQDVEELERHALIACIRYLEEEDPDLDFVYAITSFGTRGRVWPYPQNEHMVPLLGSKAFASRGDYIELHSSEAGLLGQAIDI